MIRHPVAEGCGRSAEVDETALPTRFEIGCGRVEIVRDYRELPKVVAPSDRLAQVFLHLIDNASDAMDGSGKLSVATRASGAQVEIDIADTGPGIVDELMPVIFDPFVTTKAGGASGGIGLTVVRRIVEDLGGTVKVRTRPGAGAVFTVVLPVRGAA